MCIPPLLNRMVFVFAFYLPRTPDIVEIEDEEPATPSSPILEPGFASRSRGDLELLTLDILGLLICVQQLCWSVTCLGTYLRKWPLVALMSCLPRLRPSTAISQYHLDLEVQKLCSKDYVCYSSFKMGIQAGWFPFWFPELSNCLNA